MKANLVAMLLIAFCAGCFVAVSVSSVLHRGYYEVTKTNIGEFILRDNKVYGIYEISRNQSGDMVVK